MGLDCFFSPPDKDTPFPEFEPELDLITGIAESLVDLPTFRGKTYNDLIEKVTGVSLYQTEIGNMNVRGMAQSLEDWIPEEHLGELDELLGLEGNASVNCQQYNDLKRMFRAHADAGFSILGWW
jgi:hypothetical protein